MKLSPLDVQHQEFDVGFSGYRKRQVQEFLERVADSLEETLRENQRLRDELSRREQEVERLQLGEAELKRTVIAAERVGNDIKQNAKREAALIVQEAKARRNDILRSAELRLRQAQGELTRLERENRLFREQFRGMLQGYERSLDNLRNLKVLSDKLEENYDPKAEAKGVIAEGFD